MKFYRTDFYKDKSRFVIIPTIIIVVNNMLYVKRNIAVEFHWTIFHARIMWIEGGNE